MSRRTKLLSSLSTLTIVSAVALSACGSDGEGEGESGEGSFTTHAQNAAVSEGEGSESEGEGASNADPVVDDVEYLHRLGQVRGHLVAFITLHQLGAYEMSQTHAKHPESELYADLKPAFAARGKPGFAAELSALVNSVDDGGDVNAALTALNAAISAHEPMVSVATKLRAIGALARTAADEFAIGVEENGAISNAHEYQDAFGFLTAAQAMLASLEPESDAEIEAIEQTKTQLQLALENFGDLTAAQTDGQASTIFGAAARIEIAALGLN